MEAGHRCARSGHGGPNRTSPLDLPSGRHSLHRAKLWCLAVVFVGTLVGGVSPYFMLWNEAFLALGTQFVGESSSATPTRQPRP